VAVKRLFSSLWEQEKFDEFFRAEAKMMRTLNHPNVVRFFGAAFDTRTEHGFLVTEYCCKGSLSALISARNPRRAEVQRARFFHLAIGVARGMEFVHARGFVHRDLKPDNVLLNADDVVKLCDFGLSKAVKQTDATMMTSGVGTPAYMAVELITGESDSVRCGSSIDVFSMGVLMWALWTREVPYAGAALTPFRLLTRLADGMRPDVPDDAPPRLAALMRRCWRAEPTERPPFGEVRRELEGVAAERGEQVDAAGVGPAVDDDGLVVVGLLRGGGAGAGAEGGGGRQTASTAEELHNEV